MYRDYLIMQEAGSEARRSVWGYARPRRVAVVNASGQVEALGNFEYDRYLTHNHRQYCGGRYQWRTARNLNSEWRDWNGTDDPGTRGRAWRLVVTLKNGNVKHEAYFQAWRKD